MSTVNAEPDRTVDLQIVLGAIARTAAQVCEANDALIILRVEGDRAAVVARHGRLPTRHQLGETYPLTDDMVGNRVMIERRTIHLRDLGKAPRGQFLGSRAAHLPLGVRTMLVTPLLRDGNAIGAIGIRRRKVQPFTRKQVALLKTFANQAAMAIENARLSKELHARNTQVTEALEQQTATAEILRVISSSPTDVQPVFNVIVENACRLCEGVFANVVRFDGELMHNMAQHGFTREAREAMLRFFPAPPTRGSMSGRAILSGAVAFAEDAPSDSELSVSRQLSELLGFRAQISVPMVRDGTTVGAITVARRAPGRFPERQVDLLRAFADQAVIAIENVRLFKELEVRNKALTEALEQQTATADILQVISSSPTEVQPVFDALAESAARLCDAYDAVIYQLDADALRLVGHVGPIPVGPVGQFKIPLVGTHNGRVVLERRTMQVADLQVEDGEYPEGSVFARRWGQRTVLGAPLLRAGEAIGVISVRRTEVRPFADQQVALLQTFADQAVIAIENVRLFKELQEKNEALTQAHAQVSETLERQTATGEILRVIASSPTDLQPVFTAIAESAKRLLGGFSGAITRLIDDVLHLGALTSTNPAGDDAARAMFPIALTSAGLHSHAARTRAPFFVVDMQTDSSLSNPRLQEMARARGWRSFLAVPMLQGDQVLGTIGVSRREPGAFRAEEVALLQTFADQAVIAIENVRLFKELEARNRDLTESLDQQTATSEILRVISSSPTALEPVAQAIADSAGRLCDCAFSAVFRFDGELIHWLAARGASGVQEEALRNVWPRQPDGETLVGRVILARETLHIHDAASDATHAASLPTARATLAIRSWLGVPIQREGEPIGVIVLVRLEVRPFSEQEITLVQTFANQAVIAIENVRLFNETKEALEQQTATSEILKVISSSPTDVQPVFDTIAAKALDLCKAKTGTVFKFDGERLHVASAHSLSADAVESLRQTYPMALSRGGATARAVLSQAIVYIPDVREDPEYRHQVLAQASAYMSALAVPMLHDGQPIGAITVTGSAPGAFSQRQIELLKTFADQAVIAVENVRLFKELESSNRELTTALDQQTATSEVLRTIAHTKTDPQPVFDTIVESAARLCHGAMASVFLTDGQMVNVGAIYSGTSRSVTEAPMRDAARSRWPRLLAMDSMTGIAILTRSVVHVPDIEEPAVLEFVREVGRAFGFRGQVTVPMLREGEAVGAINVARREPGRFSDAEVELLQTFADQAVIAVENARLLTELQARTADLTRSVGQLTALGEVGQAVSSSLDLETVLTTIVSRAVQLSRLDGGVVFEYDEAAQEFTQRAATDPDSALTEARRTTRIGKGEGVVGRTAMTLVPVQVPDITAAGAYEGRLRETLIGAGVRAVLAVPMVREGRLIGCLAVTRNTPGEFQPDMIDLLRTFATQSSLAIQNARLFREIEIKSRQLEAASQHKSEFLANMSHELRTPLNAIIGFSEVLTDRMFGELNEKQDEYLKDIYASGTHLLSLINDILDLSKIEAGRMELELTDFDLPSALDNALMLVRERAGRRSLTLQVAVDAGLGQIRADERKVRQVVLNLLSNAIKFTPEGGRIEVLATSKDGSVEVSVSDTGIGIAPEDQEKVFEEFRQVGTVDKKAEGTGLGLTLCRKFIELHGGRIWVRSQPGAGSTFTFTIPVRRGE